MSGGLDSTLAAKIIKDQGIEVIGLHLVSPFGCRTEVTKSADAVGIPLIFKEKGKAYLDLVENPRYGYGRNMNPCIDCRIFMFQLADVVMRDEQADFVVTGEVVGQRPMSQTRHAMDLIDKKSNLEGLVLRPLSAQCLPPTLPEQKGWVDREMLFKIVGRSRREQLAMVQSHGITEFSNPGGGCLLTESGFSSKLKDFFEHGEFESETERLTQSQLLRLGRHFRLSKFAKVVLGRNHPENIELERLWKAANGIHFKPMSFDGPSAVAIGKVTAEDKTAVGEMIVRYGKATSTERKIAYESREDNGTLTILQPMAEDRLNALRI